MKLIDADALQKDLAQMWYDSQISITGMSVSALIDNQPIIEAESVRRGKWINHGGFVTCSVCNEEQYGIDTGRFYCQNCGAKMEVEE